jgi:hypothetical protein
MIRTQEEKLKVTYPYAGCTSTDPGHLVGVCFLET